MTPIELAVALATIVVALEFLSRQLKIPRPVVLALGGLLLGLAWRPLRLPDLSLPTDLTLALLLPPILALAAYRVALGAFRSLLRPILMLAVGLVAVTMLGVAGVAHALVPAISWPLAFALGALLAPPDVVTATSVADRLGIGNRLVTILEGEGLVNDATSLVAYQLAVAAVITGHFSWGGATLEVLRSTPIGVLTGLVMGWLTAAVRRRVDDPMVETVVSLVVPYIAWLLAERIGGSSVLAVVTFGFFIRHKATELGAAGTRLANRSVWQVVDFITGGLVFLLVGIEIGRVSALVVTGPVLLLTLAITTTVIVLRLLWMWLLPELAALLRRTPPQYTWGERTVLGWAGMRGVVSLALALALPAQGADGPVAARDIVILAALSTVLLTLVGQGASLGLVIRWLGIGDPGSEAREIAAARQEAIGAARDSVYRAVLDRRLSDTERDRLLDRLKEHLSLAGSLNARRSQVSEEMEDVLVRALAAARRAVLERRDRGELNEDSTARLEAALDMDELALRGASGDLIAR